MLNGRLLRRRLLLKVTLIYTALIFGNEWGHNLWCVGNQFFNAKVLRSIGKEMGAASKLVAFDLLWMTLAALLLTALLAFCWSCFCVTGFERFQRRFAGQKIVLFAYWFITGLAFLNVYYTLHDYYIPSSRQDKSIIAMFLGDVLLRDAVYSHCLWVLPFSLSVLATTAVAALGRSRRLRIAAPVTLVLMAIVFNVYSWAVKMGPVRQFPRQDNIVVMGLDSYQLNRLALGGHPGGLSPNVDALLKTCYRFDNMWTPFARTYPSWVCMLTGRYPVNNGIRFNLVPESHLNPTNKFLPEELRRAGYTTYWGIDETRFCNIREKHGFDHVHYPAMGVKDILIGGYFDFTVTNLLRQFRLGNDLFPYVRNNRQVVAYHPRFWTEDFLKSINRLPADRPLYLNFHLCGNHWPFTASYPFSGSTANGAEDCIRMVDFQVGLILDYLQQSGLYDNATMIVLSDHGDGWNGDLLDTTNSHGDNFDHIWSNKVIFGIHNKNIGAGTTMHLARLIDFFPTVLEFAGQQPPADIDGVSLLPIVRGEEQDTRSLFAECGIDQRTFNVKQLIADYAAWYQFDPKTHLLTLRQEGIEQLMPIKSYMAISGDKRLTLKQSLKQFQLFHFDRSTGLDFPQQPVSFAEADKIQMLEALVEAFKLDRGHIFNLAYERRFLKSAPVGTIETLPAPTPTAVNTMAATGGGGGGVSPAVTLRTIYAQNPQNKSE